MTIIEIEQLPNGAHRNQSGGRTVPDGWAVFPDNMARPNFPFGDLEAEEINGMMTVTSWVPLPMPEPEPIPDPEPSTEEILNAMLGVTTNE